MADEMRRVSCAGRGPAAGGSSVRRLCLLFALALSACARYQPGALDPKVYLARAQSETEEGVTVTSAALSAAESAAVFGVELADDDIQPVWIKIENRENAAFWYMYRYTDPLYFSPAEVAFANRLWFADEANRRMAQEFDRRTLEEYVPPQSTVAGFVYTRRDPGMKVVGVTLLGDDVKAFEFVLFSPDLAADHRHLDPASLYGPDEVREVDEAGLREAIERLPRCATNADGSRQGDPLNFVLIGDSEAILAALVRAGWDETEVLSAGSAISTADSFLFGSRYRYAPVSPLYVFGRPQDAAFQKTRGDVNRRNHLRLWLTPLRYAGEEVWIGQISRDIGVRFTAGTWNLTTHAIDPDVDAERWYLAQDLASVSALSKYGVVGGVGVSTRAKPRLNAGGDPYFTDGLRAVLFVASEPVPITAIEWLHWREEPMPAERAILLGK
ncbi:MAG: LssY C-terminal domain-containing protein [Nitrococcus sp.]|nr:LssY C-terminal domain-containing protein [Nitrococcus sp.]